MVAQASSILRDKFTAKGARPDGGDGRRSILFCVATRNLWTLLHLRYVKMWHGRGTGKIAVIINLTNCSGKRYYTGSSAGNELLWMKKPVKRAESAGRRTVIWMPGVKEGWAIITLPPQPGAEYALRLVCPVRMEGAGAESAGRRRLSGIP